MDLGLSGKVAAVGGASRGLGYAAAKALSAEGALVGVSARDAATVRRAAASLGDRAFGFTGDLTDLDDCRRFAEATAAHFGRLDIVVANSGGPKPGKAAELTAADFEVGVRQSMTSSIALIAAALPHLRAAGAGRVICITSVAVRQPIPDLALSNAARAGLAGYAKTLADEVAADGITVNLVCPGMHATDRFNSIHADAAALAGALSAIPVGRLGDPDELGALVAFLASDKAGFITGQALVADGGASRAML